MCACMYACMHVNFSRTVWPHWGVLTASVKAGCSFEVVSMCPVVAYPISPVFFHTKWLLWHVHVRLDCAGSHETGVPGLAYCTFPQNFPTKKNSCEMSVCISTAQARTKCASRRSWDRSPSWTSSILSFIIFLLLNIHILIFLSSSSSSSSPAAAAASTASPSSSSSSSSSSSLS